MADQGPPTENVAGIFFCLSSSARRHNERVIGAMSAGSPNRRSSDGNLFPADHQRAGAREHVCAGSAGVHDGVRDHQPDQLRARRDLDGGGAGQLDGGERLGGLGPAGLDADDDCAGVCGGGVHDAELPGREDRVPAAAQCAAPGAADHGHGHEPAAADPGDDHLEAQPQALPAAAADRADRPGRAGDHGDAVPDPGPDGGDPGLADVAGQSHQAGPCDARDRREPAGGRADGREARLHHLHHLRDWCGAGGGGRPDVGGQLRHGAAHHGLHAGAQGLHGGRAGRHRQPGRRDAGRGAAGSDRGHRCGLSGGPDRRRAGQPLRRHLRLRGADPGADPEALGPAGRARGGSGLSGSRRFTCNNKRA
eukprot:Opistho-2@31833